MALRWGIASAGKISHDFATALGTLPESEHVIVAVAAQDLDRSKEFAKLHKIPEALLGYAALAAHPDVGRHPFIYEGILYMFLGFPISWNRNTQLNYYLTLSTQLSQM